MQLTYQKLKPFALSYLTAPLAVFFAGYLRAPFAVAGLAVLAFAWWYAVCKTPQVKQVGQEEQGITLSVPKLVLLFALMLLWGYLGGQTGFFYQNSDWGYRNAIYRDLITNSWPVYYPQKDTALVYYIGHWLVPAALTKPVYALFGLDAAWMFARMALWGWTALGTYLVALNLLVYLRADTGKKQGIGLLFLIFFSGMDILGALYSSRLPDLLAYDAMHLEWWTNDFQFSSLTTCLFWVFNQTVGAWLATVCFLQEKDCRNYLLLGTACLMCGPFPFVGLVIFMVVRGIVLLAQRQKGVRSRPLTGFCSYRSTCTPWSASQRAASHPASPAPMILICMRYFSAFVFSIFFTNPQPSLAQYSWPRRLNSVLPQWGQVSGTGSSHVIKLQVG